MAGSSHRTAQPLILAAFRPWGGSAGAGRVRPAGAKIRKLAFCISMNIVEYFYEDFVKQNRNLITHYSRFFVFLVFACRYSISLPL
jgi:hypothetical protein